MTKLVTVVSEVIKNKYPNYSQLPIHHQKSLLRNIIKQAVQLALPNVRIPTPPTPIRRAIEELRYKRRSDHYRRMHKPINYELLEMLYIFKKGWNNITQTSSQPDQLSDYSSTNILPSENLNQNNLEIFGTSQDISHNHGGFTGLFKIKSEDGNTFTSITMLKEKLNSHRIRLRESLNEINSSSSTIDDSLFSLYDLSAFLTFVDKLEKYQLVSKNKLKMSEYVDYAYTILRNHYFMWLKKHGRDIMKTKDVEKELLNYENFRKLESDNPLVQGYVKLFSQSMRKNRKFNLAGESKMAKLFKKSDLLIDRSSDIDTHFLIPKSSPDSISSEIIRFLYQNNGKVSENVLIRRFLLWPISVDSVIKDLERDGLVVIKKTQLDNLIQLKKYVI